MPSSLVIARTALVYDVQQVSKISIWGHDHYRLPARLAYEVGGFTSNVPGLAPVEFSALRQHEMWTVEVASFTRDQQKARKEGMCSGTNAIPRHVLRQRTCDSGRLRLRTGTVFRVQEYD